MTQKPRAAGLELDDLLRRLPTGVEEPTDAGWNARLESTLQRILPGISDLPSFDAETTDVLETPLPPEVGEPVAADPFGLSDGHEPNFDELHTPMQSGEHSPLAVSGYGVQPGFDSGVTSLESRRRQRWLNWGAVGAGSLAAAAALTLYVQRQSSSHLDWQLAAATEPKPAASPVEAKAQGEGIAPNAASTSNAVTADNLPSAETRAESEIAVASVRTASGTARGRSAAVTADEPAAVAAKHGEEPPLVPAAGPSTLMDHPSNGAVSAALSRRLPEAQRCLAPGQAGQSVRVVFRSSGSVERIDVLNPETRPDTRGCIDRALKLLKVEPFARSLYDVTITVSAAPVVRQ